MAELEIPGNYTLGRGKMYLARSQADGPTNGFRYVGNTPALDLTVESETLEHFGSDKGVNELDASVTTQVTRNGTFTMDDVQPENLALFVRGMAAALAQVATADDAALLRYDIADAVAGEWYQIGQTAGIPTGITDLENVTAGDSAYVAAQIAPRPVAAAVAQLYTPNEDYEINADLGLIRFLDAGPNFTDGDDARVYYTLKAIASTLAEPRTRVTSGFAAIRGSMMFLEENPAGRNRKFLFPNVELAANGAASLKGDEWRAMPMSYRVLSPAQGEAVYIDAIPSTVALP